jgi:glycosyltransferase involved in cell wall biosynthesis
MPALWSLTRISLVVLKKTDRFKTVVPSKIFESMAMGTPVVLGVEGQSREIIQQARSGICFEPENGDQLASSILELYNAADLCAELGSNGRRYAEEFFDRSVLAKRYERLMAAITQ